MATAFSRGQVVGRILAFAPAAGHESRLRTVSRIGELPGVARPPPKGWPGRVSDKRPRHAIANIHGRELYMPNSRSRSVITSGMRMARPLVPSGPGRPFGTAGPPDHVVASAATRADIGLSRTIRAFPVAGLRLAAEGGGRGH